MPGEPAQLAAGFQIPQPHGAITGAGKRPSSAAQHGYRLDKIRMVEPAQLDAGHQVPQAHGAVERAGKGPLPIREHRHRHDHAGMTRNSARFGAGLQVP